MARWGDHESSRKFSAGTITAHSVYRRTASSSMLSEFSQTQKCSRYAVRCVVTFATLVNAQGFEVGVRRFGVGLMARPAFNLYESQDCILDWK